MKQFEFLLKEAKRLKLNKEETQSLIYSNSILSAPLEKPKSILSVVICSCAILKLLKEIKK